MERREFLRTAAAAGSIAIGRETLEAQRKNSERTPESVAAELEDNIYARLLGVKPHIGAHEHISRLSGSRMPSEVVDALVEANRFFVDMNELTAAAGRRIAELIDAEAALVTAGGFSSMILGATACLTGTDPKKMEALPHPDWPRRECLIQTPHRFDYDRAYRAAGMTIVQADTRDELLSKLGPDTAMIATLSAVKQQREFGPPKPRKRVRPSSRVQPDVLARSGCGPRGGERREGFAGLPVDGNPDGTERPHRSSDSKRFTPP
jgi:hypothetical protein